MSVGADRYAAARTIAVEEIPVIDTAPLLADEQQGSAEGAAAVARDLRRAAETVGFFYIRNHGIPETLLDEAFALARRFFALPEEQKAALRIAGRHRGWLGFGGATMPGERLPDLKESFIWGFDLPPDDPEATTPGRILGFNRWPEALPEMPDVLNRYFTEANRCGARVLRAFAVGLGIDPGTFTRSFDRPVSRGSLIHYPPQPPDLAREQFGVSPHTDFGVLTLLAQDMNGGLQVRGASGDWVTAHPIPGTLVVNVGDLLARWSNDRFASTPHRVVNSSGRERYSIAFALDPDHDTLVEPIVAAGEAPRYEPVRCGDYIDGRYTKAFAYRRKQA